MNGFGVALLVSLAGVDVGWETAQGGQLVYTIRIDSIVLDELRKGQAVESQVERKDRTLKNFRVATGARGSAAATATASSNLGVQYGWRPNAAGGLDYFVQITPERFESLAKGIPIDCEVHPDVTELARIYVFIGVETLPRDGGRPATVNPGAATPGPYTDRGTQPASATVPAAGPAGARLETPATAQPGFGASASNAYSTNNTSSSATDPQYARTAAGWQADPNAPRVDDRYPPLTGANSASAYNRERTDILSVPRYADPAPSNLNRPNDPYGARPAEPTQPGQPANTGTYGYGPAAQAAPYGYNQNQVSNPYAAAGGYNAVYPPPAAAPAYPLAQPPTTWNQSAAPAATPVAAPAAAATTTAATAETKAQSQRDFWWSLFLTTMALFASLGANAYLGWLAWSYFWRYKDAASDVARARTAALQARHAA